MTLLQQRIATGVLLLVALWVFWISFSQQPAAAFLFPRLISVAFVALAGWTFARAAAGRPGSGDVISLEEAKNILPGVVVAGLYVFVAAKWLGFYTASAIAFFALLSLYDPAPHHSPRTWGVRLLITAGYVVAMYLLFSTVLGVFTPRGLFI